MKFAGFTAAESPATTSHSSEIPSMEKTAAPAKSGKNNHTKALAYTGIGAAAVCTATIVAYLIIGTVGWFTQPTTPMPITRPVEQTDRLRIIPHATQQLSDTINIAVHRNDRNTLVEYIHADIARHGGYIVSVNPFGTAEFHVPEAYVERIKPIIDESTWAISERYRSWVHQPPDPAIAAQPANTTIKVATSRHIATRPFYVRSLTIMAPIMFTALIVMIVAGVSAAAIDDARSLQS